MFGILSFWGDVDDVDDVDDVNDVNDVNDEPYENQDMRSINASYIADFLIQESLDYPKFNKFLSESDIQPRHIILASMLHFYSARINNSLQLQNQDQFNHVTEKLLDEIRLHVYEYTIFSRLFMDLYDSWDNTE